jgi:hypothetical protein
MHFMTSSLPSSLIKQVGLVVTLQTCVWEVLSLDIGWDSGYPEVHCGSTQSLQTNAWILPQIDHDHFIPSIFHFIIHVLPYHLTLHKLQH